MRITPKDIATFLFCPYLKYINKTNKLLKNSLSLFESCVIESIKKAEQFCLIRGTDLYPRKIITQWDNTWWPEVTKHNISLKEAEKLSIRATNIFNDYCKYDISGYPYMTAGVDVPSQIQINRTILASNTDILKVNIDSAKKNIHLLAFGNKNKDPIEVIFDPEIRTLLYSFYSGKEDLLSCSYIRIKESQEKILVTSVVLRHDDIEDIKKLIFHVESGIRNNIKYQNYYNCKECKQCQLKL